MKRFIKFFKKSKKVTFEELSESLSESETEEFESEDLDLKV